MSKFHTIIRNPFLIVLPMLALFAFGWQQYTSAQPQINSAVTNILPNGGLDTLDANGFPSGWQLSPRQPGVTATSSAGHNSPTLLTVSNSNDTNGVNTTLESPTVAVQPDRTYLYKGFHTSTVPFDLIMRTNHKDKSHKDTIVGHYDASSSWATASAVFQSDRSTQSVQLIYSLAAKGNLKIDNTYLEPNPTDSYVDPIPSKGANLVPNPALLRSASNTPEGWSGFTSGNHQAANDYITHDGAPYLRTQISNFKDGEAKWQYEPVPVKPHQLYEFSITYKSDTPIEVVAEYTLSSGERQFQTLTTLLPAKNWTTAIETTQTPAKATSLLATPILRSNGTLSTKDYQLNDRSRPGTPTWQRPLVSITFDDGWQSSYDHSLSLLQAYDFNATFYLNPSSIDTPLFMSSTEVDNLERQGHQLASHGVEHLDFTTLKTSDIKYQLEHSRQYFTQIHNQQTVDFAPPFGATDSQVAYYAHKYYNSLRGTESGINTRQNFNPYGLYVLYIGKDTPLATVKNTLAEAKARNGWLILVYHRVDTNATDQSIITPTQLQQQLDIVKQSGLSVVPVSTALQEVRRQP